MISLVLSFIVLPLYAAAPLPSDPNQKIIQDIVDKLVQKDHIPGMAALLYVDGKPYTYYVGDANREKKIRVTSKTIFEIGSISKLMTNLLFAQEIDYAKVSLTTPVSHYLPHLPTYFDKITLQNLATHTSGLPFTVPDQVKTQAALDKYLKTWFPKYGPSEEWTYSNFGIGLLADALQQATHTDFSLLYRRHIINLLGMEPLGFTIPKQLQKWSAIGYDSHNQAIKPTYNPVFKAASGLNLSASDMQRFLSAAIGLPGTPARIFYPMRMTESAYVKLPDQLQGLGWQIHPLNPDKVADLLDAPQQSDLGPVEVEETYDKALFDGDALIDKTGTSDNGFKSYIAIIPNKKSGIVLLTNKKIATGDIENAAREILFRAANVMPDEENE
jgi:beta-lactamase class C